MIRVAIRWSQFILSSDEGLGTGGSTRLTAKVRLSASPFVLSSVEGPHKSYLSWESHTPQPWFDVLPPPPQGIRGRNHERMTETEFPKTRFCSTYTKSSCSNLPPTMEVASRPSHFSATVP